MAVDARGARESLKSICNLLGGLTLDTGRVRWWMASQGGCAVVGPTHWSRAAFADLDSLPKSERARWCVWKSVELLYLLSTQEEQERDALPSPMPDRNLARQLAETRRYMEENLDEPLTIPALSRRACLSATTFKEEFRRMYGLPVHTWLRQRRMERAAELLHTSGLSLEKVAQAVGYSSVSQFAATFRRVLWGDPWKVSKKCLIRQQFGRFGNAAVRSICYNISIRKGTCLFPTGGNLNETTSLLGLGRRDLYGHGDDHGL